MSWLDDKAILKNNSAEPDLTRPDIRHALYILNVSDRIEARLSEPNRQIFLQHLRSIIATGNNRPVSLNDLMESASEAGINESAFLIILDSIEDAENAL